MKIISGNKIFSGLVRIILLTCIVFSANSQAAEDPKTATDSSTIGAITPPEEEDSSRSHLFIESNDTLQVTERRLPAHIMADIKKDDDFWYADTDLEKSRKEYEEEQNRIRDSTGKKVESMEEDSGSTVLLRDRPWFQTLLWVLIISGFAVFLFMYLSGSQVGLFRKKDKVIENGSGGIETESIFERDYQREIERAESSGNYRLAVRLYFLNALRKMSEKNIIKYKPDKTNGEYLQEIRQSPHYDLFFRVTRNYEFSWYGQFPIQGGTYGIIRDDFKKLFDQLH